MNFQLKRILFQTLWCSLLSVLMRSHGTESDMYCLKSIKDSLEDPFNYLSSWNFDDMTEDFMCGFDGVECWTSESKVMNLKLSNMGLKGQFPRGFRNCSSMTGLDLSSNELSGPIPSDVSTLLKYVTYLDLSNNKFTGEIPRDLANCTYLSALKLDNNKISGQIPRELGQLLRMKTISFANNNLSGPVPVFTQEGVYVNYDNNSGLCGRPVAPCSVPVAVDEFHQSFKDGIITGYVFSMMTSVIVVFMSYSCFAPCAQWKQKKNNHLNKAKELGKYICSTTRGLMRRLANQKHELLPMQLVDKGSNEISVLLEKLTSTILFEEIREATACFSVDNAIGVGKMGIMYQGRLPNGQFLAVKKIFNSEMYKRQFLSEIMILGKYRHRNIVPMLGFCIERNEWILAYHYMSNGRLSKWLHPLENDVMRLRWLERFNIALGIARGLSWLHHSCNLHVVHLNICSECILLDENFEPKISNFGEAKFMILNTEDDLGMIFKADDGKKDVYDFGSILFELIIGKTYDELSRSSSTTNLCANPSNFYNAIDKSLIVEGFEHEVCTLIKIACVCVHPLVDQRPTMLQVYINMKNIRKVRHGFNDDPNTPTGSEVASVTGIEEIAEL